MKGGKIMSQIGVVTEQGDLGLGFQPITEQEQATIEKQKKENEDKQKGAK
jgi:hypothetical protein